MNKTIFQSPSSPALNGEPVITFQHKIYDFYQSNKRNFSWRENITPYKIFISEVMLQQTQTARVTCKFESWCQKFPDFLTLAQASTHQVLSAWQGLGYNRRALALHKSAQIIARDFGGALPQDPQLLQKLPRHWTKYCRVNLRFCI